MLAELECYALADQIYVRSAAEVRERTHATLERFIIMDDVTLVDRTMEDGSIALEGPRAGEVIGKLCGAPAGYAAADEMPEFASVAVSINTHHCRLIRRSHFGSNGFELVSPRAGLPALWQGLRDAAHAYGGGPVGYAALEALRIQAGVKYFGPDFNDTVIPPVSYTHLTSSTGKNSSGGRAVTKAIMSRGTSGVRRLSPVSPRSSAKSDSQRTPPFSPLKLCGRTGGVNGRGAESPQMNVPRPT